MPPVHKRLHILLDTTDLAVAKRNTHTFVKADGFFCSLLTDSAAAMQNSGLHEHLKAVIKHDQRTADSSPIVRSVEELDGQDQ